MKSFLKSFLSLSLSFSIHYRFRLVSSGVSRRGGGGGHLYSSPQLPVAAMGRERTPAAKIPPRIKKRKWMPEYWKPASGFWLAEIFIELKSALAFRRASPLPPFHSTILENLTARCVHLGAANPRQSRRRRNSLRCERGDYCYCSCYPTGNWREFNRI